MDWGGGPNGRGHRRSIKLITERTTASLALYYFDNALESVIKPGTMTVITKSSGIIKKQVLINPPQLEYKPGHTSACCKEEVVDLRLYPGLVKRGGGGGGCCVLLCGLVLALLVLLVGLMLYQQHPRASTRRYQGFCSIPMTDDDRENSMETKYRVLPLRWPTDADVQIISTVKEKAGEDFVNALREELDEKQATRSTTMYQSRIVQNVVSTI